MPHSNVVTQIRRTARYITSDFALLNMMAEDFGAEGGAESLGDVLGVASRTAVHILAGLVAPDMHRVAYHYGYMPDEESTGWRMLPMAEEPFDAGPPMRWSGRVVEYLRRVLGHPSRSPGPRILAWRMDTTEARLRDAMRRHDISGTKGMFAST